MVAEYIATRPILDLYEQYVWNPGSWVSWRWWDQEVIYLEGEKERATTESDREEDKYREGVAQEGMMGCN